LRVPEELIGYDIALRRFVVPDGGRLGASKMKVLFFWICLWVCLVRALVGMIQYHTVKIRLAALSNSSAIGFGSSIVQCGYA